MGVKFEMSTVEGWETKRFDEIGTIFSGSTPSTSISSFWDGEIVWVTPNDLSKLNTPYLCDSGKRITEKGLNGCSAHLLPAGSLVMSSRAPIGYVALPTVQFCTNQGCKTIKLKSAFHPEFTYYNVLFNIDKVKNLGEGTTFAEISKTALSTVELSFPTSLPEQTKIAEILSTVDRAIEQTEALIAKQQRIKTGLMLDLLTRGIDEHGNIRSEQTHEFRDSPLGSIPVEWDVKPIEQKLEHIIDYRGRTPKKVVAGIPLLTAKNVRDGYLSDEPCEFIAEENYDKWMTRGIPECGDVMFTTEAPMGNVARVPDHKIALAQRVLTLSSKRSELTNEYLFWILHWSNSHKRLEALTSGSTVVGIKQSVFRKVLFQFPKVDEQKEIAKTLDSHEKIIVSEKRKLKKLRSLKTALMQDLLTGKKRVTALLNETEKVTS